MSPEAIALLDDLASQAPSWFDLAGALRAHRLQFDAPDMEAINAAFSYTMSRGRRRNEVVFRPLYELTTGVWPTALDRVSEPWKQCWREAADRCTDPCSKARLADLLWESRHAPNSRVYAEMAITAYLALVERWNSVAAPACCARAIEIACQIGAEGPREQALARAEKAAAELLSGDRPVPGLLFPYLRAMTLPKPKYRPAALQGLAAKAREVFAGDPWMSEHAIALQVTCANGDATALAALQRERAEIWETAALAESGLKRLAFLDTAVQIAKSIPNLRDRLIVERQKIRLEDLGLQRMEVTAPLDRTRFDGWVQHVLGAPTAPEAVDRLIGLKAPSGNAARTQERAREAASGSVLSRLVSQSIVTTDGVTVRQINTEEGHDAAEAAQWERMNSDLAAQMLLVPVLSGLPVRYPGDTAMSIMGRMPDVWVHADARALIVDALEAYWQGSYMTCACLLVPIIENAARNVARAYGRPLLEGDARGYVPLNEALELVEGRIDESWRRFLVLVLVADLGFNLRNEIAHGLRLGISASQAALMLHCLLYLGTLNPPATAT